MAKIKVNELTQQTPTLNDTLLASGENNEYACKIDDLKTLIAPSGVGVKNIKDAENGGIIEGLVEGEDGKVNVASGHNAHAEGGGYSEWDADEDIEVILKSNASGDFSHAEGVAHSFGMVSHAEGKSLASGEFSHAEGHETSSNGKYSHAEGKRTNSVGEASHAEGSWVLANGEASHAEGSNTNASGYASHTEGRLTVSSGENSHSEGYATCANHRSQHVFGEDNIIDPSTAEANKRGTYVEIVGNGSSSNKSNARTLDWSGNEWISGSMRAENGFILKSPDGSLFTLTVANDGTLTATKNV